MLRQIKVFFDQHIAVPSPGTESEDNLQLACAALFIEMMHMDDRLHADEYKMILQRIGETFSLPEGEASALIDLAVRERGSATDYYQFTSLINKGFSQQQKIKLIKSLWQIAYADGVLDKHEEYMVRKMADLLHVPHLQFIKTKNQVNGG